MKNLKRSAMLAGAGAAMACAVAASANDEYLLIWSTLDGGGGLLSGGDYELVATIGQPEGATVLTGDDVELIGGYWVVAAPPERVPCLPDFNLDGFVDFFDYDEFVGSFESGAVKADFNRDGFIDFFDYDGFVGAFEQGC
jgi:hypothetical protein